MSLHDHMNHPSVSVMARAIHDRIWTGLQLQITGMAIIHAYPAMKGKLTIGPRDRVLVRHSPI